MVLKDYLDSIDRRTFLQILSFTGITGLIYPRKLIASLVPEKLSRVIIVEDDTATKSSSVNEITIQAMVNSGIKALTHEDDIAEAWKTLLPGISPSSIIAIKVNCRYPALPTHPQVTNAVIEGIKHISFDGKSFNDNNIIIYENWKGDYDLSGFTANTSDTGVRCLDTESTFGYSDESYDVDGSSQRISKIITDVADHLINISVLKNHATAGATLCLKNHFGSCDYPRDMHGGRYQDCDPYIAALNALPPIKIKQRLNICDALFGVKSGGPRGYPQFAANKLVISQDIVATDYWGRKILEENGCQTTSQAHHIDTAATEYNLGTNDPAQMDLVNIRNPSAGLDAIEANSNNSELQLQQNYPNPFNKHTQISFHITRPEEVRLSVFDSNGQHVRGLINQKLKPGWHEVSWNGRDGLKKQLDSGLYICQLKTEKLQKAIIMKLV
jgi:uncharacterized protein (DUF362 family)